MTCNHCGEENAYGVNYCKYCGTSFSDEDKDEAYFGTFWGALEKLEDAWAAVRLKKLTDSRPVRIATIVLILAAGLLARHFNGSQMRVMQSEEYTVEYNTVADEYYLLTTRDEIAAQWYFPHQVETLNVSRCAEDGTVLERTGYDPSSAIMLQADTGEHFLIEADYVSDAAESQTVYVFKTVG